MVHCIKIKSWIYIKKKKAPVLCLGKTESMKAENAAKKAEANFKENL